MQLIEREEYGVKLSVRAVGDYSSVGVSRRSNEPHGLHPNQSRTYELPLPVSSRQIHGMKTSFCRINRRDSEGIGKVLAQLLEILERRDDLPLGVIENEFPLTYH